MLLDERLLPAAISDLPAKIGQGFRFFPWPTIRSYSCLSHCSLLCFSFIASISFFSISFCQLSLVTDCCFSRSFSLSFFRTVALILFISLPFISIYHTMVPYYFKLHTIHCQQLLNRPIQESLIYFSWNNIFVFVCRTHDMSFLMQ